MNRKELNNLLDKIILDHKNISEKEEDSIVFILNKNFPDAKVSDFIYWENDNPTVDDVIRHVEQYYKLD